MSLFTIVMAFIIKTTNSILFLLPYGSRNKMRENILMLLGSNLGPLEPQHTRDARQFYLGT